MSYAPYPAYKDSGVPWLGQIPEAWQRVALKRYLETPITDGPHETPNFPEQGVPFISAEAIRDSKIDFSRKRGFISKEDDARFSKKYKPRKGDIYVVKSGATTGRVAMVETDEDFNIWSPLAAIRVDPSHLDGRYLFHFLGSKCFTTEIELGWSFGTQQNIGMGVIGNLNILLPTLEEQTAIADFLDKRTAEIDDLIAKKEELLRLLAEQRTALITHAVTKGLNPNAPMKPSGVVWFDQVPAHWQVRRLKDVGTLTGGAGFPHEFQNVQGEELFFYKVGDLAKSEDGIHLTSAPHTVDRETAAKLRATVIPPDAILYAKIGAALLLNRRRISTANCCIDNNMTAWIVDPSKVLPLWGFYWMSTVDFGEHTNPGAVPSLSEGYQSVLPIALPPLDEQQSIVDQLVIETKAIDQTTKKTQEAIERLREYRTALITNAVTGKIKVS